MVAADKIELVVASVVSQRDTTLSVSQARQRRWMPIRAKTSATPRPTLVNANGKNAAESQSTVADPRFSMASKISRFQTLMPYCTATLKMISNRSPTEAIHAMRSPLSPQNPRPEIQNRSSR